MLYEQIAQNKRRTIYVMTTFIGVVMLIGAALGFLFLRNPVIGLIIALVIGLIYMAVMLSQSLDVVMQMNQAREITDVNQAPMLFHIVEDMALAANVPMPRLFIIDEASPNAFATGKDPEHSAIAVTRGLLERLNRQELEGVIGHEMSHIRNYDIRLQTTALALGAVITWLTQFGTQALWWGGGRRHDREDDAHPVETALMLVFSILALILGPLAATLTQMALSRNREYLADASAVELTRNPQGLIDALEKISQSEPMENVNEASAAMYIANPLKRENWDNLFATHPPMEKRIARLKKM